jgi:preprotein translocase subunit SecD
MTWRRATARRALALTAFAAVTMVVAACGSGGSSLATVAGARFAFAGSPSPSAEQATLAVMQARAKAVGGTARLVDDEIVVQVPGGASTARALATEGHLGFRPVLDMDQSKHAALTPTDELQPDKPAVLAEYDASGQVADVFAVGPELLSGAALESASSDLANNDQWEVRPILRSGPDGIGRLNQAAAQCYSRQPTCPTGQLALVLDGKVLATPTVDSASFERDQITISGGFTKAEATHLAVVLDGGQLPVPLVPVPGAGSSGAT